MSILVARSQDFPRMVLVRQELYSAPLKASETVSAVRQEFAALDLAARLKPGMSVAIAAGSRGIDQYLSLIHI